MRPGQRSGHRERSSDARATDSDPDGDAVVLVAWSRGVVGEPSVGWDVSEVPDQHQQGGDDVERVLCAFDPVHGHGMSVAALEARELSLVIAEGGADLSRRFHRRAARHVDTPWAIATGHLPDERGRVAAGSRLFSAYLRTLLRAGASDPELAHAFARVSHLVDPPTALMMPVRLSRVLMASRRSGRRTDRSTVTVRDVDQVASVARRS